MNSFCGKIYKQINNTQDKSFQVQMQKLPTPEELLKYTNLAREQPQKFASFVEADLKRFAKNGRTIPLTPTRSYETHEGRKAWEQCVKFLKQVKKLPPLKISKSLTLAAEDHVQDMVINQFQSHEGSDGSSLADRIKRRCKKVQDSCMMGENIGEDFADIEQNIALNIVKGLVIDDGVPGRGHRNNIFSPHFKFVGFGIGQKGNRIEACIDYHTHDPEVLSDMPLKIQKNNKGLAMSKQERRVLSTQTQTSTSTINGKTTKKVTVTKVYSDSTTEVSQTTQQS